MKIPAKVTTIPAGGGTSTIDINEQVSVYYYQGTAALLAGYAIVPSAVPTERTSIDIFYNGNLTTTAANFVTVFGTQLSFEQALRGKCWIHCFYDPVATAWVVSVSEGYQASGYEGVDNVALTLNAQVITLTYSTSKNVLRITGGPGALTGDVSVVSAGTFPDGFQQLIYWNTTQVDKSSASVVLLGQSLNAEQVYDGGCLVLASYDLGSTTWRVQLVSNPNVHEDCFLVPWSFETGEQANNSWVAPCNGTLTQVDSFVTKAVGITADGTLTLQIAGVGVTNGVVTVAASSAINDQDSATPTALNTFTKGQILSLVSAKGATAGGKGLATIRYTTSS